jgi:hypothetical protein
VIVGGEWQMPSIYEYNKVNLCEVVSSQGSMGACDDGASGILGTN